MKTLIVFALVLLGFPGCSHIKISACNAGDPGLIPGSGRFPGGGNGKPLYYAWRIPWMEEPGGLQTMARKEWLKLSLSFYAL